MLPRPPRIFDTYFPPRLRARACPAREREAETSPQEEEKWKRNENSKTPLLAGDNIFPISQPNVNALENRTEIIRPTNFFSSFAFFLFLFERVFEEKKRETETERKSEKRNSTATGGRLERKEK